MSQKKCESMKKLFPVMLLFLIFGFLNHVKSQGKPKSVGYIPILAWGGPPSEANTFSRYNELKESGITLSFTSFPDVETMEKALIVAQKTGIRLIVSCPELKTDTKNTVRRFMNNPAVTGYFLGDEPNRSSFHELAKWVKEIRSIDDRHFCYINLFPNYANEEQLGTKTYREYVNTFIKEVPVQLLSFDYYPIVGDDSIRKNWYENLEIFSDEARKAHKPFWAFALTVAHGPYPVPTLAELRLQVFSDLAYGAQGIQYFTYWTPKSDIWNFHHGPITLEHKRSEIYDRIKLVNEEVRSLSRIFLDTKVVSIAFTGDSIPLGTKLLKELPEPIKELETKGTGALVAVLKKSRNCFLVVVNRDFNGQMELTIKCDSTVEKVLKDGTLVPANDYMSTMEIDPGDIAIYKWNQDKN